MDDHDGAIEIQHFDGTLEETEPDDWLTLRPDRAEAPDDWSGSVDISDEDLPGTQLSTHRDWQSELELIDADRSRITETE